MGYIPGTLKEQPFPTSQADADRARGQSLRRSGPKDPARQKKVLINAARSEDDLFVRDEQAALDAGVQRRQEVYDICRHAALTGTDPDHGSAEGRLRRLLERVRRMLVIR